MSRVVENYDDAWDYEPRFVLIGEETLFGRGVPRMGVLYGVVLGVLLFAVMSLPGLSAAADLLPVPSPIVAAGMGVGMAWWLWVQPPGGVRPHHAIRPVLSELLAPRTLHGWVPAQVSEISISPETVPLEPDFSGRWPRAIYTGPGTLIRVGGAREVRHRRSWLNQGPTRTLLHTQGVRRGGPQRIAVPVRASIALDEETR